MPRIFGILVLVLSILFFPPSVLALISNNAVPGDISYPVKIKLEEGIVFLTSFHPTSQAWFSVTRSNRRFQEVVSLLASGKAATQSLNELVTQTDLASALVLQITDQSQKQEFINNLQQSIQKYDDGLAVIAQSQQIPLPEPTFSPVPTSLPSSTPKYTSLPAPTATVKPQPTSVPTSIPTTAPSLAPVIIQPSPSTPTAPPGNLNHEEEIKKAREKLEEIKKKLAEERKKVQEVREIERSSGVKEQESERRILPEGRQQQIEDRKDQNKKEED